MVTIVGQQREILLPGLRTGGSEIGDDAGYEVTGLSFVPTRVDRDDYTIIPLPHALADPSLDDGVRALYEDVVADTAEVVRSLGVDVPIFGTTDVPITPLTS